MRIRNFSYVPEVIFQKPEWRTMIENNSAPLNRYNPRWKTWNNRTIEENTKHLPRCNREGPRFQVSSSQYKRLTHFKGKIQEQKAEEEHKQITSRQRKISMFSHDESTINNIMQNHWLEWYWSLSQKIENTEKRGSTQNSTLQDFDFCNLSSLQYVKDNIFTNKLAHLTKLDSRVWPTQSMISSTVTEHKIWFHRLITQITSH